MMCLKCVSNLFILVNWAGGKNAYCCTWTQSEGLAVSNSAEANETFQTKKQRPLP